MDKIQAITSVYLLCTILITADYLTLVGNDALCGSFAFPTNAPRLTGMTTNYNGVGFKMMKRILKETWMDFFGILLIIGVGIPLFTQFHPTLILVPILLGIALGANPYVKIRLILDKEDTKPHSQ